jgi:hypothetical protein
MNGLKERTPYTTPPLVRAHRQRVHNGEVPGLEDPLVGRAVRTHGDEADQVADIIGNEHGRTGLADPLAKQRWRRELALRCPEDVRERFPVIPFRLCEHRTQCGVVGLPRQADPQPVHAHLHHPSS